MQAVFEPNFLSWVKSLPDSKFEERDIYRIQENLRTLIFFWQDHENANARLDKREAEIRSGVDLMIKLAFEYRDGAIHTHRCAVYYFPAYTHVVIDSKIGDNHVPPRRALGVKG